MSPTAGGEADKFGNRYEGRWTIFHVLTVLSDQAESLRVEERGDDGRGIEFAVTRRPGVVEGHQVKRQSGNANGWTIKRLVDMDIVSAAKAQVGRGRSFHFVSTIPCRPLDELSDRARRADDAASFVTNLTEELTTDFNTFQKAVGPVDAAFDLVRQMYVQWPDERQLVASNAALAESLVEGASGAATATVLGDLVLNHLGQSLDKAFLGNTLIEYGLSLRDPASQIDFRASVDDTYAAWDASISRELLDPPISRSEGAVLAQALRENSHRVVLVAGAAGVGKSSVLRDGVGEVSADGWPVLAIRLDRMEGFSSTHELGVARLGLAASPVAALAAAADGGDCLLVVDQLDAASKISGRLPATFDSIAELVREAVPFPNMRIAMACRDFDVDNDDRLRGLFGDEATGARIVVEPLGPRQVERAVTEMGLSPQHLTQVQVELLVSPLNLVLLAAVAADDNALEFRTTTDLLDAFWERKRRDCSARRDGLRFTKTISVLTESMSARQQLSAPATVLDDDDLIADAEVMVSEHILTLEAKRLGFFHETFFDYAFARRWVTTNDSLVGFLKAGDQELFRRAQVRQILARLRDDDPTWFVREIRAMLGDSDVRFHLKEVVIAVLRALPDPTEAELQALLPFVHGMDHLGQSVALAIQAPAWFPSLDADGVLGQWILSDEPSLFELGVRVLLSAKEYPDRVALLVGSASGRAEYGWLVQTVAFHNELRSRSLFEQFLSVVDDASVVPGQREFWMTTGKLADYHPDWACELVARWLAKVIVSDPEAQRSALSSHDYWLRNLIEKAAARAPIEFASSIIPLLVDLMAATAYGDDQPRRHRVLTTGFFATEDHDVEDALLTGAQRSVSFAATITRADVDALLRRLAEDPHDGAQWLLYQGLISGAPIRAEWAGEILLQGDARWRAGYADGPFWSARELLGAIGGHLSDETLLALESASLNFSPDWEDPPGGDASFELLSALPEARLSPGGRLRLGELRRRFRTEQPEPPTAFRIGRVESPISEDSAARMSDRNWIDAMAKHANRERDVGSLVGGANELAGVLQTKTSADPERFSRLALSLTSVPAVYQRAFLSGLQSTTNQVDPDLAVRVILKAEPALDGNDRKHLAWAARRFASATNGESMIDFLLDDAVNGSGDDAFVDGSNVDLHTIGINSVRGAAVDALSELLAHDTSGDRAARIAPLLGRLAADPKLGVRACVAELLVSGLRLAEPEVLAALPNLLTADDRLFTAVPVQRLLIALGNRDAAVLATPVETMLASEYPDVRVCGGRLGCYARIELTNEPVAGLMGLDASVRRGAADVCGQIIPSTSNVDAASAVLVAGFHDADPEVRNQAAQVASSLRHKPLLPHRELLRQLIGSPAFDDALPQLLLTFEYSPDPIDDLMISLAERFLELHTGELGSIATSAAADSKQVGELVMRAYARAEPGTERNRCLNCIDELLRDGAFGFSAAVDLADR